MNEDILIMQYTDNLLINLKRVESCSKYCKKYVFDTWKRQVFGDSYYLYVCDVIDLQSYRNIIKWVRTSCIEDFDLKGYGILKG